MAKTIPEILGELTAYTDHLADLFSQVRHDEVLTIRESAAFLRLARSIAATAESLHSRVAGNPPPAIGP